MIDHQKVLLGLAALISTVFFMATGPVRPTHRVWTPAPRVANSPISIASSDPPDGAIDARQPSKPDGTARDGWNSIVITFDGSTSALTPADFTVTLDPQADPPSILTLIPDGNKATLQLDRRIPLGAWTVFTHNESGTSTRIAHLPADVNGSRMSSVDDVIQVIDCLNGCAVCKIWQCDVDRSAVCGPPDILRVIDLLKGAGAYDVWNHETLPD